MSWQSTDEAIEKSFRSFVQKATKSAGFELDLATRGAPGAPEIASTIFSKIEQADVFVADVSLVGDHHLVLQFVAELRKANQWVEILSRVDMGQTLPTAFWSGLEELRLDWAGGDRHFNCVSLEGWRITYPTTS